MRAILFLSLLAMAACSQKKTKSDPNKTLCPPDQDCRPAGQKSASLPVVPIDVTIDAQKLTVNAQQIEAMTCMSPTNEPCTDANVRAGKAYVQLAQRPSTAKLRPIPSLTDAAQTVIETNQNKATKDALQTLRVHASVSYHLFTETFMSLQEAGIEHPRLALLGDPTNKTRSITRAGQPAMTGEPGESPLNVAVTVYRNGYHLLIHRSHRRKFEPEFFRPVKQSDTFKTLDARLGDIKTEWPTERRVNLAASPEVSMGRVIEAIDVVQTHFPKLKLVPGSTHRWANIMNRKMKDQLKTYRDRLPPKKDPQ